jgi:phage-related protein
VEVAGRNGDLHFDNGRFANVDLTFTAYFMDLDEFNNFRDKLVSQTGYQRLEDSHHPDEFRQAVLSGGLEPDVLGEGLTYVQTEITFTAKPQRFLKSGERLLTLSTETTLIQNPTNCKSNPLIRVYGYGILTVDGISISISTHSKEYVVIDCDIMDCYANDGSNMNAYFIGEYPVFPAGNFTFQINSSTISKVEIIPRWWRL